MVLKYNGRGLSLIHKAITTFYNLRLIDLILRHHPEALTIPIKESEQLPIHIAIKSFEVKMVS
jgi:hypothetical protein